MTKDIDLSGRKVIIGTEKNPFKGKFDGKGNKITNYTLAVSGNKQGLFGVVYGGTVGNFKISGTITIDGVYTHIGGAAKHIGGVVGSSESLSGVLTVDRKIFNRAAANNTLQPLCFMGHI